MKLEQRNELEIIKIRPQGFCKGVVSAINTLNERLLNDDLVKPIYMLGGIVHNKHIINAYSLKGIKIISFEDIKDIEKGTIIITAHGLSNKKRNYIQEKCLNIIDTTCKEVRKIQDLIFDKEKEGYKIIYFGSSNHPECKAIIEDHQDIFLIENEIDAQKLNINNDKILFASQTTASYETVSKIEALLKFKFPNIETTSDICNATKSRQLALIEKSKECDMILVIGDKMSNNTNKLVELGNKYSKAVLIDEVSDLEKIDFSGIKKLGVTAGASTPNILVEEIIKKIQNPTYVIDLKCEQYINIK